MPPSEELLDAFGQNFDVMVREVFKNRDKATGDFKETKFGAFRINVKVIPLRQVIEFANSSCNVCFSKGYQIKHMSPKDYNLTWCSTINEKGEWEVLSKTVYDSLVKLAGTDKKAKDKEGKEVVIGKHPERVRIVTTCTCCEKKAPGWLHNKARTEWYEFKTQELTDSEKQEATVGKEGEQ